MLNKNKEYFVYMHISPTGKVYIGLTCQNPKRRWRNGKAYNHNLHFSNAIKKYGWENFEHIIIASNLSKEDAEKLEMELIAKYDSTNREKGYNITSGGECFRHSEESKRKMSSLRIGKRLSEETKQRMSDYHKGRCGVYHNRSIPCICVETGIKYHSFAEAERETNIDKAMINRCCKGKQKTAGGYHWKYAD